MSPISRDAEAQADKKDPRTESDDFAPLSRAGLQDAEENGAFETALRSDGSAERDLVGQTEDASDGVAVRKGCQDTKAECR